MTDDYYRRTEVDMIHYKWAAYALAMFVSVGLPTIFPGAKTVKGYGIILAGQLKANTTHQQRKWTIESIKVASER
jgi:pyruvate dehydrogenase complex dehydrogenase (E1) component